MNNLFSKTLNLIAQLKDDKLPFTYTTVWGVESKVVIRKDVFPILLDFGDYDENILLEDCDDHLLYCVYKAVENQLMKEKNLVK